MIHTGWLSRARRPRRLQNISTSAQYRLIKHGDKTTSVPVKEQHTSEVLLFRGGRDAFHSNRRLIFDVCDVPASFRDMLLAALQGKKKKKITSLSVFSAVSSSPLHLGYILYSKWHSCPWAALPRFFFFVCFFASVC